MTYKAPARSVGRLKRPFGDLYYEVTGTGPALLFAHGLGGNHLSWWQQVAHFAPHYTCVSFAHRGFAPSSAIDGGPDPADYASDLAALIDHLRFPDVRLVGQSMGGWTMLEYAIAHPAKVKALVLSSTSGTLDRRGGADVVFPAFLASAIAAALPCGQAHLIPHAGHSPYFEEAATFNGLVEAFLARQR